MSERRTRLHPAEAEALAHERQNDFLERILPMVAAAVRRRFGWRPDVEDLSQEAVAHSWSLFVRAIRDGLEPLRLLKTIRKWSVGRAVQLAGSRKDVLSPNAQRRHGFRVAELTEELEAVVAERRCRSPQGKSVRPPDNGTRHGEEAVFQPQHSPGRRVL
jgi:hypothetical protein